MTIFYFCGIYIKLRAVTRPCGGASGPKEMDRNVLNNF